jgi:hypothetical protein
MFGVYHNRLQSIVNEIGACASLIPPTSSTGTTINRWNNGRASTDQNSHCFVPDGSNTQEGVKRLFSLITQKQYPQIANSRALSMRVCALPDTGGNQACCTTSPGSPDVAQNGCTGGRGGFKTITLSYDTGFFNTVLRIIGGAPQITTIRATTISRNSAIDQHEK